MAPLLRERIEAILSDLAPQSTDCALDVGCGAQPFRNNLEKKGYRYFGLDVEPTAGFHLEFQAAIDQPLPDAIASSGPYPFVLCTEVLEHVVDWATAFANLAQLTATGGRVLITCPHYYILHEEPYDFWRPTPHAIRYYANRSGFEILHEEMAGDPWDLLGTWLGAIYPVAARPGPIDRFIVLAAWAIRRAALFALVRGWPRRLFGLRGKTYLSNIAVLGRK